MIPLYVLDPSVRWPATLQHCSSRHNLPLQQLFTDLTAVQSKQAFTPVHGLLSTQAAKSFLYLWASRFKSCHLRERSSVSVVL